MISGLPTNYIVTPIKDEYKASKSALWHVNEKRRIRHMRFPSLKYRHDNDSLQENVNVNNSFKKWNDEGEYRSNAPCRDFDSLLDPTSGFVSAGTDINKNNNHMKSFVQINKTPQSVCPNTVNAVEQGKAVIQPLFQREKTWAPGESSLWNSRKTLDVVIRSKLGGWTSTEDPRKLSEEIKRPKTSPIDSVSRLRRNKLALKYQYGTTTQRAYEEVPWDSILPPKVQPPITTLENKPDSVSQQLQNNCYETTAQEWQNVGKGLDSFLPRNGYYKDRPVTFCSPYPRFQQIPSYSGCIGAVNLEESDNVYQPFSPFSVKRNIIPLPSETSHRPNIPLYTGCTMWQGCYEPFKTNQIIDRYSHLSHPTNQLHKAQDSESSSGNKRKSEMSKMITLVPPHNPFNTVEKEAI